MPANDQDLRALTYLAKRIRDDTPGANRWDEAGIAAKLAELKGQSLASVAERVVRHAGDVEAKTPGALLRPFLPPAQVPSQRNTFDPAIHCDVCSRAEHLHRPHDGHNYLPANQHRPADVDVTHKVALLRDDISCTDPTPPTPERKPAEPNPQVERLRAQIGADQ